MPITPAISIAVQDETTLQGHVGTLNFAGAGVGATVAGDVATITIAGGSGPGASATRVVTVPAFPAKHEQTVTVVDAAVSATSRINAWCSGLGPSVVGSADAVDLLNMHAIAGAGTFDLVMNFLTPFAGSLSVDYMVLA